MDAFNGFSSVIASVLSSAPPDAGSAEAAMAQVAVSPLEGPKPPLLAADQRLFVQTRVLPALLVIIAREEIKRVVPASTDQLYYAPDKSDGKQVGVEVLASRYYRNNGYPDMPIRIYGASGGPYYHCAELVWNSAILAGFHVPMNRNPKVPQYYGFLNSANVLYDQCDSAKGVAELATPPAAESFKTDVQFKDAKGTTIGLAGPRIGDVMVARRDANAQGVRHPGHVAMLHDVSTTPPKWVEAGSQVRDTAQYELSTRAIDDEHDTRLVRLRNPDWNRIERWLAERATAVDFAKYNPRYPAAAKENSYRGLFALALAAVSAAIAADSSASGEAARAQVTRLQELLGITP